MIRTMARVTDVHQFEDEEDGVDLPAKIVNEDLRRFFMPKKYAEPEAVPEPVPEAEKVEEKAAEEPVMETEPLKEEAEETKPASVPAELLRKSEQHAQSPKSAYAPGAFNPRAPTAPQTSPSKAGKKWWRMGRSKSRMAVEAAPAKGPSGQPLRFVEKHAYTQPSAKELLAGERPLQPTPGEAHAEEDPHAPEPAAATEAADEVAPACEADGLVDEVTPAAEDGTAAAGEPIAEAMVALQEVMEPAPVAAPALEEGTVKEMEHEAALVAPVVKEKEEEKMLDALSEDPVQAVHEAPVQDHKEAAPAEELTHKEEAAPVEATAHKEEARHIEEAAPIVAAAPVLAAAHEESAAVEEPAHEEDEEAHHETPAQKEETHLAEPKHDHAAAVEEPAAQNKATERKAITMNMIMNVEPENAAEAAEHRPVSCRFVVDEDALPPPALSSTPENGAISPQSSPQKEVPINTWYNKGGKKSGGLFGACFGCFKA